MVQLCKDYGMERVQKSCFWGRIGGEKCKKLEEITKLLELEDNVCLIPMTKATMKLIKRWGTGERNWTEEKPEICFF